MQNDFKTTVRIENCLLNALKIKHTWKKLRRNLKNLKFVLDSSVDVGLFALNTLFYWDFSPPLFCCQDASSPEWTICPLYLVLPISICLQDITTIIKTFWQHKSNIDNDLMRLILTDGLNPSTGQEWYQKNWWSQTVGFSLPNLNPLVAIYFGQEMGQSQTYFLENLNTDHGLAS